jgi:ParB family transcriptional regulator, chromosome partitioning protein
VAKRGLPTEIKMRHDSHYVEELVKTYRTVGKIIPVNQIEPNPEQPRVEIGDLSELTASISEKGVLEPLLVKPVRETGNWMIIAGERRWRAANLAGLMEVPCIELDIDEKSIAEIALIENLQRKDLTIWEEADGLAALAKSFNYTHEEIAKKISKSRTTVTESMTIAGIPVSIREKCREANIAAKSTLLEIARQFDDAEMLRFVEQITNKSANREEIRKTSKDTKKAENKISALSENTFNYTSSTKAFNLQIKFTNQESFEKKEILQALKEAFDSVKAAN